MGAGSSEACDDAGIEFLCSVFSLEAVERLERIGVAPLQDRRPARSRTSSSSRRVAATGKPVLLTSGMRSWERARRRRRSGGRDVTVLQCTSAYPTPPERVGLERDRRAARALRQPVGFSDHTLGTSPRSPPSRSARSSSRSTSRFRDAGTVPTPRSRSSPPSFEDLVDGDPRDRGDARAPGRQGRPRAVRRDEARLREVRRLGRRHSRGRRHRARDARGEEARHGIPAARLDTVVGRAARAAIPRTPSSPRSCSREEDLRRRRFARELLQHQVGDARHRRAPRARAAARRRRVGAARPLRHRARSDRARRLRGRTSASSC